MYPPVLTKLDFVRRYAANEFGNMPKTWETIEEFEQSGFNGLIHIRNRVKGGKTWYNVKPTEARCVWDKLISSAKENNVNPQTLYLSAMGPEDNKIFQGEVQRGYWGLDLYCNNIAKPMREVSLKDWYNRQGIIATLLLKHFLCPNSYEWLQVLLDRYPDHVVEFSTYNTEWGTLPGYNTVFWEVRKY
jgi:hypothetical protein